MPSVYFDFLPVWFKFTTHSYPKYRTLCGIGVFVSLSDCDEAQTRPHSSL